MEKASPPNSNKLSTPITVLAIKKKIIFGPAHFLSQANAAERKARWSFLVDQKKFYLEADIFNI